MTWASARPSRPASCARAAAAPPNRFHGHRGPAAMTIQWKDELEAKFGLWFEIIDASDRRDAPASVFSAIPWATGSRFIISHRLLTDEVYSAGLRDVLGEFRARALFILDEAHHAAPAAGIAMPSTATSRRRFARSGNCSSTGFSCRRPRTTATPTAFPLCWKCWIPSGSPAEWRWSPTTLSPSWCGG